MTGGDRVSPFSPPLPRPDPFSPPSTFLFRLLLCCCCCLKAALAPQQRSLGVSWQWLTPGNTSRHMDKQKPLTSALTLQGLPCQQLMCPNTMVTYLCFQGASWDRSQDCTRHQHQEDVPSLACPYILLGLYSMRLRRGTPE